MTAFQKILEALNKSGLPFVSKKQLLEETGLPDNTLRGRLSELCQRAYITKQPQKKFYRITGQGIMFLNGLINKNRSKRTFSAGTNAAAAE
jgi:DNA-binding IclR family transcriptional regulator